VQTEELVKRVESLINHGAKKVYLAVRDVNSTQDLEEKIWG
jgi:hypothetical protein